MTKNDLIIQKREVWYGLQKYQDILEKEGRALTDEEKGLYNEGLAKLQELQGSIDTMTQMEELKRSMNEPVKMPEGGTVTREEESIKHSRAVDKWMRKGMSGLTAEERKLINPKGQGNDEQIELRAQNAALLNPTYVQTTDIMSYITDAKRHYGGWLEACDEIRTGAGRQLNFPEVDDTSLTGALEAAGTDIFTSADDITLATQQLDAYFYSSQGIKVNNDDLADADFDLAKAVGEILGRRLWRKIATDAMTANGSSKPQGLALAAAKGLLTGDCTITYERVVQFLKTVDWAYHKSPGTGFMFHQSQLFDIMSLQSTTAQPLWQPSMAAGQPDTFMGYKYWVANELTSTSTVTANSRHMLFGDFKQFKIRYAGPTILVRLNELYASTLQTGFAAIQRMDSDLLQPNTTTYAPVKYLRRMDT